MSSLDNTLSSYRCVLSEAHDVEVVNISGRHREGDIFASVHCGCVCLVNEVYVCECLLPSVADTFCAYSYQQMPPDCPWNNQLYMPDLMSRRQIRGGIRIPGPQRTALPFGLKEQLHRGVTPSWSYFSCP